MQSTIGRKRHRGRVRDTRQKRLSEPVAADTEERDRCLLPSGAAIRQIDTTVLVDDRAVNLMQTGSRALPDLHQGGLTERTLQPDRRMPAFGFDGNDDRDLAGRHANDAGGMRAETDIRDDKRVRREVGALNGDPAARDRPQRSDGNDARSGSRSGHGVLLEWPHES